MSFLRGVWADLVDKRLWPVALGLLVAVVAVPVLLHQPGSDAAPPAPRPAASASTHDPGALPSPVVSLSTSSPRGVLVGSEHNPFRPQHVPKSSGTPSSAKAPGVSASATSSATSAGASTGASGGSTGSGSSPTASPGGGLVPTHTGPSNSGSSTGRPHEPKPHVVRTYVRVSFGEFGHGLGRLEVAALKPLPPIKTPFLVYLGRATNKRTAVFSVSAAAQPASRSTGGASDGVCHPSRADCHTIHLNPGDRVDFAVTASKGTTVTHYRLIVTGYVTR